ncbi:hypothetical protein BpHYR1_038294 [Brachionus plicatilis]|uniref:Uncharacterized protein n=1 Tax=Brachionus plicatilis TaxID=10195 RepID=A0A3M7SHG8_BRAPC|nr:hypothetical protein BpHYR1_038294 [Brachionus plicatilis]
MDKRLLNVIVFVAFIQVFFVLRVIFFINNYTCLYTKSSYSDGHSHIKIGNLYGNKISRQKETKFCGIIYDSKFNLNSMIDEIKECFQDMIKYEFTFPLFCTDPIAYFDSFDINFFLKITLTSKEVKSIIIKLRK